MNRGTVINVNVWAWKNSSINRGINELYANMSKYLFVSFGWNKWTGWLLWMWSYGCERIVQSTGVWMKSMPLCRSKVFFFTRVFFCRICSWTFILLLYFHLVFFTLNFLVGFSCFFGHWRCSRCSLPCAPIIFRFILLCSVGLDSCMWLLKKWIKNYIWRGTYFYIYFKRGRINPGANPDVGCIDGKATVAYQTVNHP